MTIAWRFKLSYALFFTAIGILYPYLALYFQVVGLSGAQIGILLALLPLLSLLTQPLWALLGDVYQLRRNVLVGTCFGLALITWLFTLSDSFWWLLALMVLLSIVRSPISSLCDALALEYLESLGRREEFGGYRLWGSVGFAIASFAVGALVIGSAPRLIVHLHSLAMLAMGLVALGLPNLRTHSSPSWREGLTLLRGNPLLARFLLGVLPIGATLGVVNQYLIIYMEDIHAAGWVSGLAFALSATLEVPLMAQGAALIRRWGLVLVMLGGAALLPLRWLLYTQITAPLLVIPTQPLHSVAMFSLLIGGVLFVDQQLDRRWRATGQALYQASLHGVGASIGLVAAGVIYGRAGIVPVWWACVLSGSLGLAMLVWTVRVHPST